MSRDSGVTGRAASRLSVLHIVAPAAFGGLETVVQALAIGARNSPVEARVAVVLVKDDPDHPFLGPLHAAGVEVFPIVVRPRAYGRERRAIAELCTRLRPAVVHTHGYRPDVLDAAVARRLGLPVVTTVHGFTGGDWKNRCYQWLERRALRRFDGVVAVSRPLVEDLVRSGIEAERIHLIPNAWRPGAPALDRAAARRALGERDDAQPRIGWVGRLSDEKGPDVFLDALAGLRDLPWTACVLGDGPARVGLAARAAALGVAERVHWHGGVAAGRLYRAFDLFVLSSRTEGSPMVLLEAMAAGVPIVATRVGGVPDVVSAAEAMLVPPGDPRALAAAIAAVCRDPAAAAGRARAARTRLDRECDVGRWLERYESVYRMIRARGPLTSPHARTPSPAACGA